MERQMSSRLYFGVTNIEPFDMCYKDRRSVKPRHLEETTAKNGVDE